MDNFTYKHPILLYIGTLWIACAPSPPHPARSSDGTSSLAFDEEEPQKERNRRKTTQFLQYTFGKNPNSDEDINEPRGPVGYTPLHLAVIEGNAENVQHILENPAINPNVQNKYGRTPLLNAAAWGLTEIVRILLQHGQASKDEVGQTRETKKSVIKTDVNLTDHQHTTPLYQAAASNYPNVIHALLAHPDIKFNITDKYGFTPLHIAAAYGKTQAVKALLMSTEVLKTVNDHIITGEMQEDTPLMLAASNGHYETVKALLECRAIKPNVYNSYGYAAIHKAVFVDTKRSPDRVDILKLFTEHVGPNDYQVNINLLTRFPKSAHKKKHDPEDRRDVTPLLITVYQKDTDMLKVLLTCKAVNLKAKTPDTKKTPLQIAAASKYKEGVKLIKEERKRRK